MEVLSRKDNLNQVISWLSTKQARYRAYKDVIKQKETSSTKVNDVTKIKNYGNYNIVFEKSQEGGKNDVKGIKNSTCNA